ncbi:MAG: efflux transporter outer membrane subunit [Trinickia sp.]
MSDEGIARDAPDSAPSGAAITRPLAVPAEKASTRWWRTFGDTALDALVDEALERNADLAMAALRVRRAQLQARLVDAQTGPQASLTAGADAMRAFDADGGRVATGANAAVSFELDLWGKLAARRDEAAWRAQASEADRESAALLLIGTTAKLYWGIGYLNESIALGQASIVDAQRAVALIEARLAAGAASPFDAAQARQQLATLQAEQAQWRLEREAKRNALALLLDKPPEARGAEPESLGNALLPRVAPRLPAVVLARRPDLRAAELRLRARLAGVDLARAAIYPSIELTGQLGTSSDMLVRTLQNPVASIGAALALPFVQWNTVRAKARLSENEFDEASVEFRKQLYRALADVEDALAAKTQLDAQAIQRADALANATLATAYARARFELGSTDAGPWLDAQRAQRVADLEQKSNRLARLDNRIDLFLALGGA